MAFLLHPITRWPDHPILLSPDRSRLPHMHHRHMSRAEQCRFVVQHHAHGNLFEQSTQASFIAEGLEKARFFELGQNLRRDAAADIDSAGGQILERQISRRCTIDFDKQIYRLHAQRTLARKTIL